jgi:hypothetical protein
VAYYDALIAAWNSATQPPAGVTGTAITGGMTTAQKIAAVNGWTVTGSVPTSFTVTGAQLLNCINWAEFNALTPQQQSNLLALCQVPGPLLGGSGNTAHMAAGMILAYFTNLSGPTITALTALAQATVQTWAAANGYPNAQNGGGGLTLVDAANAGLV